MIQSGNDGEESFGENYFQRKRHVKKIYSVGREICRIYFGGREKIDSLYRSLFHFENDGVEVLCLRVL